MINLSALAKSLKTAMEAILLICVSLFLVSLLVFTVIEFFPFFLDSMNLQKIKYYSQRSMYIPDTSLVFTYRKNEQSNRFVTKGDLFTPILGVEASQIDWGGSWNKFGFRSNTSIAPFDILMIGDSYLEIGSDHLTLSEQLSRVSGLSTFNMGRAWYGPEQYNELFRRYASEISPKYVVYAFFGGNDINDVKEYDQWLKRGNYYDFVLNRSFFARYSLAISDTLSFLFESLEKNFDSLETSDRDVRLKNQSGVIRVGEQDVLMTIGNWNKKIPSEQMMNSKEWVRLQTLLLEFKEMAHNKGIKPLILYLPTKIEVYGSQFTGAGGQRFKKLIHSQLIYETNTATCLSKIVKKLDIPFLNLLPYFQKLSREGELLYYPFDTHWNVEGRKAAAIILSQYFSQHT